MDCMPPGSGVVHQGLRNRDDSRCKLQTQNIPCREPTHFVVHAQGDGSLDYCRLQGDELDGTALICVIADRKHIASFRGDV